METQERKAVSVKVKRQSLDRPNLNAIVYRLARIISVKKNIDINEIQFIEQDGNNFVENKVTFLFLGFSR